MLVNIYTSGLNLLAHKGITFKSANEVKHLLSKKDAALLRVQPGYRRGANMMIAFAESGGVRLYVQVGMQWMDGSLQNMLA